MKRTLAPTLLAAGLLAAACTGSDSTPSGDSTDPNPDPDTGPTAEPGDDPGDEPGDDQPGDEPGGPVGFAPAGLRQFDECAAFLDFVRSEGAERVGAYGFGSNGWWGPGVFVDDAVMEADDAMEDEPADEPAEESTDAASSATVPAASDGALGQDDSGDGDRFSTTNVQVEGVDEPDIVKTDGDRILAIAGEQFHLASVSEDGADATLRSSVRLSDPNTGIWSWGSEILFDGDRAFVIGQSEWWGPFENDVIAEDSGDSVVSSAAAEDEVTEPIEDDAEADFAPEPLPVEPDAPIGGPIPPNGYQGPTTIVHEIDLSNPDAVSIVNTLECAAATSAPARSARPHGWS